jgi:hypothetical protein
MDCNWSSGEDSPARRAHPVLVFFSVAVGLKYDTMCSAQDDTVLFEATPTNATGCSSVHFTFCFGRALVVVVRWYFLIAAASAAVQPAAFFLHAVASKAFSAAAPAVRVRVRRARFCFRFWFQLRFWRHICCPAFWQLTFLCHFYPIRRRLVFPRCASLKIKKAAPKNHLL